MTARIKPYFTLLIRDSVHAQWEIAFGDYSRALVRQEEVDSYSYLIPGNRRIIRTDHSQRAINEAVAWLNKDRPVRVLVVGSKAEAAHH